MFQKPFITLKRCLILWQCWLCCPYLLHLQAGPLMCHVQEVAMNRSPRFGSFDDNVKIIDDTNQSKRVFQSFSGTGDLPQPTTEPSYTDQHCHLPFFLIFFLAEVFLAQSWVLWIAGICLTLGWKFVKVGQRLPPAPGKAEQAAVAACPSCLSSVVSAEFLSAAGHFQLRV